jgi:zinc transporter ZupT
MDIARRLGIVVFCGVPAIIGGGVVWWLFDGSYNAVAVWEAILLLFAGGLISK